MSDGLTSFGDRLRQLRAAASLSQEELAERSGLSVRGISDLERNLRHVPRPETVRMLADALTLNEDDRAKLLAAARPPTPRGDSPERPLAAPFSLPTPLTRLIGREVEMATLDGMLSSNDARLVTITGAGGIGKTRLALEIAARTRLLFPGGVFFVDLSPLTDPAFVAPTIAAALGMREVVGQPLLETIRETVGSSRLLLVLDSCERVLSSSAEIATMLGSSGGLLVLATSREPLRIRGEREFPLFPLPLPEQSHRSKIEELARVPSVALFVERASASQPAFALSHENAASIAAICSQLDGLPLAIELAAARIKLLPPAALLDRLERRLPLLTGGGHDLPARQRTMRDAIGWSYDLLTPAEQRLFRRLAVFAGGFSLSAAEAIADPDETDTVLDHLGALLEQSLLRQTPGSGGEPRYQMLETVREFGWERLAASDEMNQARERHARHFFQLADLRAQGLQIFMAVESLRFVASEQDNARLALAWFDERGDVEATLALATTLYGLWLAHGLYRDGLLWLDRALQHPGRAASAARVRALVAAAMLAIYQGDYARAATFSSDASAVAQELDDPYLIGQALIITGFLAYRRGEYGQAERQLEQAYDRLQRLGGSAPGALADAGFALIMLGANALVQERYGPAARWLEEALGLFRTMNNPWGVSDAQGLLAVTCFCTGNIRRAAELYWESIVLADSLNLAHHVASALFGLAEIATASGRPETGARLLGAADGLMGSIDAAMFPWVQTILDRVKAELQSQMGEERLASSRANGRLLPIDQVLTEAKELAVLVTLPVP